ncbi:MAG TPA: ATP-binding cassette domain-containing protein [Candidatus Deferrimicrobium sp.]|nr:ATP-binding cassette domain-containing protein [Candidatus Deferrimicrobium sp.]
MKEHAVVIENLSRHFGQFKAVDRVSLTVSRGETFGFLGANGAGKTTTIRMLCGLLMPTSGGGSVAGFDIATRPEEVKKHIGYMSQKFSLYPDLTGRENIHFYGAAYGLARTVIRQRLETLAERLSLHEFIDRRTASLPVGWRQRLALAVALLHEPAILFLDEPTAGVDPVFRRRFWEILYELAEAKITIFVTTHYMDEAEYCGRISIMHQGRIVELGRPFDIVRRLDAAGLEDAFISLIRSREATNA